LLPSGASALRYRTAFEAVKRRMFCSVNARQ